MVDFKGKSPGLSGLLSIPQEEKWVGGLKQNIAGNDREHAGNGTIYFKLIERAFHLLDASHSQLDEIARLLPLFA